MKQRRTSWYTPLLLATAAILVIGSAALAQLSTDGTWTLVDPAASDAEFWQQFDALRAALDEEAIAGVTDDQAAAIAQTATELLLGDKDRVGLIALLQRRVDLSAEELGDPEAVVAAGIAEPEVLALAHLLIAAEALTASPGAAALDAARVHVEEAGKLLAHLRPEPAPAE